jgi:hypothetical protein
MDTESFTTKIARLHELQAVTVTFEKSDAGISALRQILNAATRTKIGVRFNQGYEMIAKAICQSGDWEQDVNRKTTVWGMKNLNFDDLCHLAVGIENIETGDHFASSLMTRRKKRQEEMTEKLITDVLDQKLLQEISGWGASIEGHFLEVCGLPAIEFSIRNTGTSKTVFNFAVDGWSGRFSINGEWGDLRFTNAQSVRDMISSTLTDILDKETAA